VNILINEEALGLSEERYGVNETKYERKWWQWKTVRTNVVRRWWKYWRTVGGRQTASEEWMWRGRGMIMWRDVYQMIQMKWRLFTAHTHQLMNSEMNEGEKNMKEKQLSWKLSWENKANKRNWRHQNNETMRRLSMKGDWKNEATTQTCATMKEKTD